MIYGITTIVNELQPFAPGPGMPLVIQAVIGLFAGFLGGLLGVGGSLIIIPGLVLYLSYTPAGYHGHDQHLLQAAAMICNVFVAAPSVLAHYRAKAILPVVVVVLVPTALAGILLGVFVSNSPYFAEENGAYLAMALVVFLLYVIGYNLWRLSGTRDMSKGFDPNKKLPTWRVFAVGLPMGFVAGLLGIGGGALCVPAQQVLLKIPLRRAIANSAATIVCVSAFGATYKNLTLPVHGIPIWDSICLALTLIPTAMVGSYLGGRLTHTLPRRVLRVVFVVFMGVVAYMTFSKALAALPSQPDFEAEVSSRSVDARQQAPPMYWVTQIRRYSPCATGSARVRGRRYHRTGITSCQRHVSSSSSRDSTT